MKRFEDFDRLSLSSLKQYIYCKRRFALMYVECEWGSNYKIVEGDLFHERVDNPLFSEKRGDLHISRSVPIYSDVMNLYGVADIIEFIKDDSGIKIHGKRERWRINPVEYKNGKPEKSNADNFQLCAQALCLEEMFNTNIEHGDIYYGKIKRRVTVDFTNELRSDVKEQVKNMKELLEQQLLPPKPKNQNCSLCSLENVCIPTIIRNQTSVKDRIAAIVKGELDAEIT